MCTTCGKHLAQNVWYLKPEQHRIRSLGKIRDIINQHMDTLLVKAIQIIRNKQPYGLDRFTGISKSLVDWLTRTFHGGQVLPTQETTFEVIDMANEIVVMPCLCQKALTPQKPADWKCIGLNIASQVYYRNNKPDTFRTIDKQEAKNIVSEWRGKGAFQTACWLWDANVSWLCNCDKNCISHRLPELDWGIVPSLVVAELTHPEACTHCQACARWCTRPGALTFDPDIKTPVKINPALCRGCGLCIDHCPRHALNFAPRQTYYDVLHKEILSLSPPA